MMNVALKISTKRQITFASDTERKGGQASERVLLSSLHTKMLAVDDLKKTVFNKTTIVVDAESKCSFRGAIERLFQKCD